MTQTAADGAEQQARAHAYRLLGILLAKPPAEEVLERLGRIDVPAPEEEDIGSMGEAWRTLRDASVAAVAGPLHDEYHALFIGVGSGELVPYGSWYMTGFLMDQPLAELRQELVALGIERLENVKEPEDHVAALCETMALLIDTSAGADLERRFFTRHIEPWMRRFFVDLQRAKSAQFYRSVGSFGASYIELEAEYHRMLL